MKEKIVRKMIFYFIFGCLRPCLEAGKCWGKEKKCNEKLFSQVWMRWKIRGKKYMKENCSSLIFFGASTSGSVPNACWLIQARFKILADIGVPIGPKR